MPHRGASPPADDDDDGLAPDRRTPHASGAGDCMLLLLFPSLEFPRRLAGRWSASRERGIMAGELAGMLLLLLLMLLLLLFMCAALLALLIIATPFGILTFPPIPTPLPPRRGFIFLCCCCCCKSNDDDDACGRGAAAAAAAAA